MPNHSAVLIKVNLSGGKYENEWLEGQRLLKYYLKATTRKDSETFSEDRVENKAIIGFPQVGLMGSGLTFHSAPSALCEM